MGCNESRKGYSQEEIMLDAKEAELQFHTKYADELLRTFTWHSHKSVITPTGVSDALSDLNLPTLTSSTPLQTVLEGIARGAEEFDLRRVQLMCLMLGVPRGNEKAKALFKMYDEMDELSISQAKLGRMCHDLTTTAIEDMCRIDSSLRIVDYRNGLLSVRDEFVKRMQQMIIGEAASISREQFLLKMSDTSIGKFLATASLRVAIAEYRRETSIGKFREKK